MDEIFHFKHGFHIFHHVLFHEPSHNIAINRIAPAMVLSSESKAGSSPRVSLLATWPPVALALQAMGQNWARPRISNLHYWLANLPYPSMGSNSHVFTAHLRYTPFHQWKSVPRSPCDGLIPHDCRPLFVVDTPWAHTGRHAIWRCPLGLSSLGENQNYVGKCIESPRSSYRVILHFFRISLVAVGPLLPQSFGSL